MRRAGGAADSEGSMRLRALLLLLLLLPGLGLATGARLRFCAPFSGEMSCCPPAAPDCCGEPRIEPSVVSDAEQERCATCCLEIDTPAEPPATSPDGPTPALDAPPAAVVLPTPPSDRGRPSVRPVPRALAPRAAPLPLRI